MPTSEELKAEALRIEEELTKLKLARLKLGQFTSYTFPGYINAKHQDMLDDKLEQVERFVTSNGKEGIGRLIVTMPPRHGKSEKVSIRFPAWFLGRNPDNRVIITSYGASLSEYFSREVRNLMEGSDYQKIFGGKRAIQPGEPVVKIDPDGRSVQAWDILNHRGGLVAGGVGGPLTGRGADVLIIDDPIKDDEEANSEVMRQKIVDWYTSVAYTRLEGSGAVICIMCMTGDTHVLMADGTERDLKDVRVGDVVATYDEGRLSSSVVKNWRSNGCDSISKITMSSGKVVRANERHPFLTYHNKTLRWTRVKDLTTDHRIVALRGNGAESCVSTTAMKQEGSEHCSVMTATLPLVTQRHNEMLLQSQSTSDFTLEDIILIEDDGKEEVFDVQIDETENFIANGVVSHNTRWHEYDLVGWMLEKQPEKWEVLNLPAIAEDGDAMGRELGEPLWPFKYDIPALMDKKSVLPPRHWNSLYQQHPSGENGDVFSQDWFVYGKLPDPSEISYGIQVWDCAMTEKETSDFSACVTAYVTPYGVYIADVYQARLNFPDLKQRMMDQYNQWNRHFRISRICIENRVSGTSMLQSLKKDTMMPVIPMEPESKMGKSKLQRANSVAGYVQSGRVVFRAGASWLHEFEDQLLKFPNGKHDDMVDSFVYALIQTNGGGIKKHNSVASLRDRYQIIGGNQRTDRLSSIAGGW